MYSINTFPLKDFILLYCDGDYSFVNGDEAAAKELIKQYEDAIGDPNSDRNEQVGHIEALSIFINRMKIMIDIATTNTDSRIMDILKDELRFVDQESHDENIRMATNKLQGHILQYNQRKAEYDKQNKGNVTVNYDWFIDTCISMSDMNKYAIRINDLTVKEFCTRYKQLIRYIAKMNEKKTTA